MTCRRGRLECSSRCGTSAVLDGAAAGAGLDRAGESLPDWPRVDLAQPRAGRRARASLPADRGKLGRCKDGEGNEELTGKSGFGPRKCTRRDHSSAFLGVQGILSTFSGAPLLR